MDLAPIISELPLERRLALAYAPARARSLTTGLLALDWKLAGILKQGREPLLAQLRLSWWRDRLRGVGGRLPPGEPVMALLAEWGDRLCDLAVLVDGWEALIGDAPDFVGFAHARGQAWRSLAVALQCQDASGRAAVAAEEWALVELAIRLTDQAERARAIELVDAAKWEKARLPRAIRPLVVLHGIARLSKGRAEIISTPVSGLTAARLGLFGI